LPAPCCCWAAAEGLQDLQQTIKKQNCKAADSWKAKLEGSRQLEGRLSPIISCRSNGVSLMELLFARFDTDLVARLMLAWSW